MVVPSGPSELDDPDVALTENVVLGLRRHESGGKIKEGTGFRAAAMMICWGWKWSTNGELVLSVDLGDTTETGACVFENFNN